jgi:acetyl esterase/lipase
MVSPSLTDLVRNTYFVGADPTDPLVSPVYYPRLAEFPPTLIMMAEFDTLRHDMNDLAADLTATSVQITHKQFAGFDHGFTTPRPSTSPASRCRRSASASATHTPARGTRSAAVADGHRFIDGRPACLARCPVS